MRNAEREDSGKYVIRAENANGSDEATVEVTVLGKVFSNRMVSDFFGGKQNAFAENNRGR